MVIRVLPEPAAVCSMLSDDCEPTRCRLCDGPMCANLDCLEQDDVVQCVHQGLCHRKCHDEGCAMRECWIDYDAAYEWHVEAA